MEWKEGIAAIEGGSSVDKWEVEGVGASSSPRKGKEETGVAIESIKKSLWRILGGFGCLTQFWPQSSKLLHYQKKATFSQFLAISFLLFPNPAFILFYPHYQIIMNYCP